MTEAVSILFFALAVTIVMGFRTVVTRTHIDDNMKYIPYFCGVLFFLVWNSEYVAMSMIIGITLYLIQNTENKSEAVLLVFKNVIYVLISTFILRKIKDMSLQYVIEMNLQHN